MKFNRNRFFLCSWLLTLFVLRSLLPESAFTDVFTAIYTVLAYGTYAAFYLCPTFILVWLLQRFAHAEKTGAALAIFGNGLILILLYADARIYSMYGFHINGFVVNLVLTPGGLDSLGSDVRTQLTFGVAVAALFLMQWGLWWVCQREFWPRFPWRRPLILVVCVLVLAHLGERLLFGLADIRARGEVLGVANSLPLHMRTVFRKQGEKWGLAKQQEQTITVKSGGRLNYPSHPLQIVRPEKPLNVIWLVAESLRADMLNPEVMPATWDYAQKGVRFTKHFSGGNGTRPGVFAMFSGLPGTYWFSFIHEERSAAVMDAVMQEGYDLHLSTGQSFTYPEFERTIFSRVPRDRLHVDDADTGPERDHRNVSRIIKTLEQRDANKPFFVFNFFETPHALYNFPPEAVIRTNYLKEFNYVSMSKADIKREISGIHDRYINSVHSLDLTLAPLWQYLETNHLRDNTVIIFAGDHGEEFWEKGHWGHNSEFVNEQVRTPMVLWVPGKAPAVDDRLSSHMDITATVMPLLGVQNPASDYSEGYSLLEKPARKYTLLSDWDRVAYVDEEIKFTIPISTGMVFHQDVTDFEDRPVTNAPEILRRKLPELKQMMQDISSFYRKRSAAK